jgi:hypothetical protein
LVDATRRGDAAQKSEVELLNGSADTPCVLANVPEQQYQDSPMLSLYVRFKLFPSTKALFVPHLAELMKTMAEEPTS